MVSVVRYKTPEGKDHFSDWLEAQDSKVRARVQNRLDRIELGNFGDFKQLTEGVWELMDNFGPGYRVYCGRDGQEIVVLLAGGTKAQQTKAINLAKNLWNQYIQEKRHASSRA